MKVLIVSTCPTHPALAGNSRFILNQVNLFERMGHEVHFLYIFEKAISFHRTHDSLDELKSYWKDRLHVYHVSMFQHLINVLTVRFRNMTNHCYYKCDDYYISGVDKYLGKLQKIHHFDACIVNYYFLSKLLIKTSIPLKGLVTHDYFAYKSELVGTKKVALNTTAHEEAKALQRSPHIFALNSDEAIYFSKLSPLSKIYNIYSYFDYHPTNIVGNHNILFLSGSNVYNINGINWFIKQIWPKIKEQFKDANLIIGGSICAKKELIHKDDSVIFCGVVDNSMDFYSKGDVVINPTFQGTGLKIKTFESISYDKISMCHPHSKIGIFDPYTAPLFSSKEPSEWVNYLIEVWNSKKRILEIKNNNKDYILRMQKYIESEYNNFFNSNI